MSNPEEIIKYSGDKMKSAINDELKKRYSDVQVFEEMGDFPGARVIENEDQAKELLQEVTAANEAEAAKSDDQRELEKQAVIQNQLREMDKAWNGMGRRGRREYSQKTYGDKYRYSARVKRRLKGT